MLLLGEGRRTRSRRCSTCCRPPLGPGARRGAAAVRGAAPTAPAAIGVYLPGNWPVPFGIVLVVDRLSALMLVLTGSVGLAALLFALARWDRAGVHFHALFQIQLMGLNGAFLTADLFNLFVFFEVMLAASYGLLLHGGGPRAGARRAALHRHQPGRLAAVPDRRGDALRRHRHAEHGRHRAEAAAGAGQRPRPAARRRGDPRHRLPGQGGDVAAELLAAAGLRRGQRAGGGDVRDPDQGRRLRRAAPVDAVLSGRRRRLGAASAATCWSGAAWPRSPSAPSACWPRSSWRGWPASASSCRRARCSRRSASTRRRSSGRRAVLPGQLDAGRLRAVPAGRTDRALAPGRGGAAAAGRRQRPRCRPSWMPSRPPAPTSTTTKRRWSAASSRPHGVPRPGLHRLRAADRRACRRCPASSPSSPC